MSKPKLDLTKKDKSPYPVKTAPEVVEIKKAIICYYLGSGNTKLACQYIAKNIKNIEIDLFNFY